MVSIPSNACKELTSVPMGTTTSETVTTLNANISLYNHENKRKYNWILLVTPYDCTIAEKTKNAVSAGFSAILLRDFNADEKTRFNSISCYCGHLNSSIASFGIVDWISWDLLAYNFSLPENKFVKSYPDISLCYRFIARRKLIASCFHHRYVARMGYKTIQPNGNVTSAVVSAFLCAGLLIFVCYAVTHLPPPIGMSYCVRQFCRYLLKKRRTNKLYLKYIRMCG